MRMAISIGVIGFLIVVPLMAAVFVVGFMIGNVTLIFNRPKVKKVVAFRDVKELTKSIIHLN